MRFFKVILSLFTVVIITSSMTAQESSVKTFNLPSDELNFPTLYENLNIPDSLLYTTPTYKNFSSTYNKSLITPESSFTRNPYYRDYSSAGTLYQWENGGIFGASKFISMPALGNIQSASATFMQQIDRFTVTASLSGTKYHYDRNLYNDFGFSGRLSYRINDNLSINAFGSYSVNNVYHSMAAMPYNRFSCFGGSLSLRTSDSFSIDMGVQRYFDPYSNHWVTVPIVAPTVNLWNHKVGIDFGGLIYQIVNSLINSNDNYIGGYSPKDFRPESSSGNGPLIKKNREKLRK